MVFDVTRLSTFEAVQMWKADLDNKVLLPNGKAIPAVLLANKVSKKGRGGGEDTQKEREDGGIDRREMRGEKRDSDCRGKGKNGEKREQGNRVELSIVLLFVSL